MVKKYSYTFVVIDFSRTPEMASCVIRPDVADATVLMKLDFPAPVGPTTRIRKRPNPQLGDGVIALISVRSSLSD